MKKLIILLDAVFILVSVFSACGNEKPAETAPVTAAPESGDTPETADPVAPDKLEGATIKSATAFSDGVAFVEYEDSRVYAVDTEGNKLFELTKDTFQYKYVGDRYYKDGYIVIGNNIYDKTGKKVEYDAGNGFETLLTDSAGGYILARGKADGNYTIGILKTDGTWAYPLSSDNDLVRIYKEKNVNLGGLKFTDGYDYYGGALIRVNLDWTDRYYYDLSTNTVYNDYTRFESVLEGEGRGLYRIDPDESRTLIVPGKCDVEGGCFDGLVFCYDIDNDRHFYLYTSEGELVKDFEDAVVYNVGSVFGEKVFLHTDDAILASLYTDEGKKLVMLDKKGEFISEPVNIGNNDLVAAFDGERGVYFSVEEGQFFSFGKDGNKVPDKNITNVTGVGDGMLTVKNAFEQIYYVDMEFNIKIK